MEGWREPRSDALESDRMRFRESATPVNRHEPGFRKGHRPDEAQDLERNRLVASGRDEVGRRRAAG